MSNAENNFLDMDSLLDATVDQLADTPEFKPFPTGTHLCVLTLEQRNKDPKKPAISWKLTAIETIELKDAEKDQPVKAGDTCSGLFSFVKDDGTVNELAQGQFKEIMRPLSGHFKTASNRDTLAAVAEGVTVAVTMSQREGKKENAGKFYPVIEALVVA